MKGKIYIKPLNFRFVVVFFFLFACSFVNAADRKEFFGMFPKPPLFDVKSYMLLDANSGYVIAEQNPTLRISPASLTKVMTLYLISNSLRGEQIHLDDQVIISEKAWRTGGSRMFINIGSRVLVEDLIKGISIASGNDSSIAMAEYIGGSEQNFVEMMNETAKKLQMYETSYADSSGLPNRKNFTTVADLAILCRAWILNFPEYYYWVGEKWMIHNGIKQINRNRLLWVDTSIDGVKTGHTEDAGYCIIASSKRDNMRLIAIVAGAKSENARLNYTLSLLNYGFRFFETTKLFVSNAAIVTPRVLYGKTRNSNLGLTDDFYVTLPKGYAKKIVVKVAVDKNLSAPIIKGHKYGSVDVFCGSEKIVTKELVALQDVRRFSDKLL